MTACSSGSSSSAATSTRRPRSRATELCTYRATTAWSGRFARQKVDRDMDVTRESVLEALGRVVTRGITLPALADDLGLKKQQYARLRQVLEGLKTSGLVTGVTGGGFALAASGRAVDRKARKEAVPDEKKERRSATATAT